MTTVPGDGGTRAMATRYQFHIGLPPEWAILDLPLIRQELNDIEAKGMAVSANGVQVLRSVDALRPDLAAVLSTALIDANGEMTGLLSASLMVITVSARDVPPGDDPSFSFRVVDGPEFEPGRHTKFAVQTLPVASEDGEMVSLLTFSSPNVKARDLLEGGFRTLAASAQLVPVPAA